MDSLLFTVVIHCGCNLYSLNINYIEIESLRGKKFKENIILYEHVCVYMYTQYIDHNINN